MYLQTMASPDWISWRKLICEAVLTRVNLIYNKIVIGSFGRVIRPANMVRCILVLVINMIIILWRLWGVFCKRYPRFKFYCISVFNERCQQTGIQKRICIFFMLIHLTCHGGSNMIGLLPIFCLWTWVAIGTIVNVSWLYRCGYKYL